MTRKLKKKTISLPAWYRYGFWKKKVLWSNERRSLLSGKCSPLKNIHSWKSPLKNIHTWKYSPLIMHKIWFLSVSVSSQYFKSLNPLRMKNIAYIGSWKHFVFVFVCVLVSLSLYLSFCKSLSLSWWTNFLRLELCLALLQCEIQWVISPKLYTQLSWDLLKNWRFWDFHSHRFG